MKKTHYYLLVALIALGTTAFTAYKNVLDQLRIAEADAKDYILGNFKEGNLAFPYSTALKVLATGQRGAAVKELGDYIRKYVNSPEFAQAYKEARDAAKPQDPADKATKLKERIKELEQDVEKTKADMKGQTGDMKKLYEGTLKMQQDMLAALKDPKHPNHKMYLQDVDDADENGEQYKQAVKDYQTYWPATVKELTKLRLKEFLAFTADIDFNAKLIEKNGRKRFEDPKLEAKDETWKRCFRSGKETITAARAYAQQWLKELN
ncbi:hypothetical protein [Paraflavitalea pollutisoli]|uniref:hypothetical protein n=1 Tax=Paraflavitalea pollutisoli TaxID=3034143 RepID=UPI0023EDAF29|nr:hypothetical protein [Paraflavitalea sp. H1-2-19X]